MRTRRPVHLSALIVSIAILAVGATACSSDDDGDRPSATPESVAGDDATPADDETGNDGAGGGGNDSERPFGVDRESLASAVATATGAASHDVDGDTIRLRYDEGSREDVTASINCSVVLGMKDPADRIEMTYPDGEFECVDE